MTDEADDTIIEDAAAVEAAVLEVEDDLAALQTERDSYKDIAQRFDADVPYLPRKGQANSSGFPSTLSGTIFLTSGAPGIRMS